MLYFFKLRGSLCFLNLTIYQSVLAGDLPSTVAYPYCFDGAPVTYSHPDYILINHGANDRSATAETYIAEYRSLLELIHATHKDSVIIVLAAFCGAYPNELKELVEEFNRTNNDNVYFIDSSTWGEGHQLHPLRHGHKEIAEKLIKALENII